MKSIVILILSIIVFPVNCQIKYGSDGDIMPFSKHSKYLQKIDLNQVNTLNIRYYDNDSLYFARNAKDSETKDAPCKLGFPIDTVIDIRKMGTRIDLDIGTLWIYRIHSKTAKAMIPCIEPFELNVGTYLNIRSYDGRDNNQRTFTKDKHNPKNSKRYSAYIKSPSIIIEYFEPKNAISDFPIYLYKISYFYANANTNYSIKSEKKSGAHGTATKECQVDITCPEASGWFPQSNSVVYIEIPYEFMGDNFINRCTGFFINKSGNYADTDKPYFISVGHVFSIEYGNSNISLDQYYTPSDITVRVDYYNPECDDSEEVEGYSIGEVNRIELGPDYLEPAETLRPNEDYSFWKCDKTVLELDSKSILYSAWRTDHDYNYTNGYASLGHPGGDALKALLCNDRAWYNGSNDYFTVYYDVGSPEKGFSGSPVFNYSSEVVGWFSQKNKYAECGVKLSNWADCGLFSSLWPTINQYVDAEFNGFADSYFTSGSSPALHCSNCRLDGDEVEVDCGGSCIPCNLLAYFLLKSDAQIQANNEFEVLKTLEIDPQAQNSLFQRAGDYNISAGENIILKEGFNIQLGHAVSLNIDEELASLYPYSDACSNYCFSAVGGFSPVGTPGYNDYFYFVSKNVTQYSIVVKHPGVLPSIIYSSLDNPVPYNGKFVAWDGSGIPYVGDYYLFIIDYIDCFGNQHNWTEWVYIG